MTMSQDSALCVLEADAHGRVVSATRKGEGRSVFQLALRSPPRSDLHFGLGEPTDRTQSTLDISTAELHTGIAAYIEALCTAGRAGVILRGTCTDPVWSVERATANVSSSMLSLFILVALRNGVRERSENAANAAAVWFSVHDALGCISPSIKQGGCTAPATTAVLAEQRAALEMLASKLAPMSRDDPTLGERAAQWIRDHS